MLSAQTSASVNKKLYHFTNATNNANNNNTNNHSPRTQDSSSMSSIADDYDFKNADISSSAQTSTNSPIRVSDLRNPNNHKKEPKFYSNNFYSGPPIDAKSNNNRNHTSTFRRSLIISPSFNSISSLPTSDDGIIKEEDSGSGSNDDVFEDAFDDSNILKTLNDPKEVPTKNMGMVISPSIRQLSDILTSKVQSNSNIHATISEDPHAENGSDDDDSTIHLKTLPVSTSLIDDMYVSPQKSVKSIQNYSTFHKTNSSDTLKNVVDAKSQPDLIDLSTPVVDQHDFSPETQQYVSAKSSFNNSSQVNYSDLFESYSPTKGSVSASASATSNKKLLDTTNESDSISSVVHQRKYQSNFALNNNRNSNRFSMMSENINMYNSPALGFNEPAQSFSINKTSINRSFSKLSNLSDSIHEIGYDNTNNEPYSATDTDTSAFSFEPSRNGTLLNRNLQKNTNDNIQSTKQTSNSKSQHNPARDSIRIVNDDDETDYATDSVSYISKSAFSNKSTPIINSQFDYDKTPKLESATPGLGLIYQKSQSTPQLSLLKQEKLSSPSEQKSLIDSPVLLNTSPIRNTSPTFENLKNSPTIHSKKDYINLSPKLKTTTTLNPSPQNNASPVLNNSSNINGSPVSKSSTFAHSFKSSNFSNLQPAKPKAGKLTFKSFFGIEKKTTIESQSSGNINDKASSRPKSFSFNTAQNQVKKDEKREKSKSLLSGWKRKSLGLKTPNTKTRNSLLSTPQGHKNHVNAHKSNQSNASLPVLKKHSSPVQNNLSSSPHRHTQSSPAMIEKELPHLPPPPPTEQKEVPNINRRSLLQTYGFDETTPKVTQNPIISESPAVQENYQNHDLDYSDPKIIRSTSEQTIETGSSPIDLPEPQTAKIDLSTPNTNEMKTITDEVLEDDSIKSNKGRNENSFGFNTSSTYETSEEIVGKVDDSIQDSKQDHHNKKQSSPVALGLKFLNNDDELLKTPVSAKSPSFSVVDSFTTSPNKYHIGDDMFPKKLGLGEIESIVSLERSRSMKSVRSIEKQKLSHKNSIVRMVQDNNESFDELVLPDGMVVVKSPLSDHNSILSRHFSDHEPKRNSSILKNSITKSEIEQPPKLYNSTVIRDSMNFDDHSFFDDVRDAIEYDNFEDNRTIEDNNIKTDKYKSIDKTPDGYVFNNNNNNDDDNDLNEFIDLINFDDTGLGNFSPTFDMGNSPVRNGISRDSSVPDFLGVETSYNTINFDDTLRGSPMAKPQQPLFYENNTPTSTTETIEDIIKEEEKLKKDHLYNNNSNIPSLDDPYQFQPPNRPPIGLNGPSFNNSLKPETKNALLGSLANNTIVPSDSENSIAFSFNMHHNESNSTSNDNFNFNDYANYTNYIESTNSPVPPSSSAYNNNSEHIGHAELGTHNIYSPTNPFTDYTQSYDDINDSVNFGHSGIHHTDFSVENKFESPNETSNRRKSINFVSKLNNNTNINKSQNIFGHHSTSSLPTVAKLHEEENSGKTKILTKKRNKTAVSFGSLNMFDSLLPRKNFKEEYVKPNVKFSSRILLYDTYGEEEYDRKPDSATCNNLTPQLAMDIKNELNQLKSEMEVHEDSRCYTHFF